MKPMFLFLAVLLAACTPTPGPEALPMPLSDNGLEKREPDSCGAASLGHLIGQNEGVVRTVRTKGAYRVIPPGALVTQDYDSFRLNVHIDDAGMIEKLTCG
jgi:hypothetical protein